MEQQIINSNEGKTPLPLPKLKPHSMTLTTILEKVMLAPDVMSGKVGAPIDAIVVAKEFAPAGRPNYPAIIQHGTGIGVWNKLYGQATTAKYIFLFLVSLNKYFNVVRPMTLDQMTELSIEFSGYTVFKFEDFIAFFEGVKRQRWGEIRDRIDPAMLWGFFRKYDEERDEVCVQLARQPFKEYEQPREQTQQQKMLSGTNKLSDTIHQIKDRIKDGK